MITIKKGSTLRHLVVFYGNYHPYDVYKITDICTLSKAVMRALLTVLFIIFIGVVVLGGIIWPAIVWVFLLIMGYSLTNAYTMTSLFMFTVCAVVGFSTFAYVQYKLWQERREYERAVNPGPPSIMQEWMASIKGKYCARVNFEE